MSSFISRPIKEYVFPLLLFAVFIAGVFMRPALPVDETRYLTVAWEMWLKHDYVHLTYNFEGYHHKPPLLFWLINILWHVFGINRWSATLPSIFASVAVWFLTGKLAKKLFPADGTVATRAKLLLLGSVPFLLYGSLIMFDMMMTAFVLGALLFLLRLSENHKAVNVLGLGVCMGLGALVKGPVVLVYTLVPAILAPLWMSRAAREKSAVGFGMGVFLAVLVGALPVLLWVIQAIAGKDAHFIYWLLWEQTAGRVTGGFSNAHGRPVFFYLPIVPVLFLPWPFFPAFWTGLRGRFAAMRGNDGIRFLVIWMLAGLVIFSAISGKQPHYLLPFLPGIMIVTAYFMDRISVGALQKTVLTMFAFFVVGNAVAMKTLFPIYDWRPVADFVAQNKDHDWAYVRNYNGEIGFLARLDKHIESTDLKHLPKWFAAHPDGWAVIRYKKPEEVKGYDMLYVMPYRVNHYAGVFRLPKKRPH